MTKLLKFITCGSVDDGKSTLIGHMLYDAKLLFADQRQSLELESRVGSRDGKIDYSLLLDGLMAEREQGITIDVAYRYFTTEGRSFIVADTPGHEEYTRNMAVGASFAELAVILVDASRGILVQTRRHARICALMGIRHFCFAVNKMDLISWREGEFRRLEKEIRKLAVDLELKDVTIIPVSATEGDNVTFPSIHMPWYRGKMLLSYLEEVETEETIGVSGDLILPVQRVCRPNRTFRGFEGQIEEGRLCIGDRITVIPSGETATVSGILRAGVQSDKAVAGDAVTVSLDREIDISRGCVLTTENDLSASHMFTGEILWMDECSLTEGGRYFLRAGTAELPATVMEIKYKVDVNTGEHLAVKRLYKNEIAVCDIALAHDTVITSFDRHPVLGSFILIDRVTDQTSGCGVVRHTLRRSDNLKLQYIDISRRERIENMGQTPLTLWFTGLSGAGKSTIANEVEKLLYTKGRYTMLLDGDNIRMGLNRNLGFEPEDRIENIRRIAEVAKLMNDAGLIVLVSFISPFRADRENAKEIIGADSFVEIYVDTPLEVCEERDAKGLYKKARKNEIPNFTGITSPYEAPEYPELVVSTINRTPRECADEIVSYIEEHRDE